MTKRAHDIAIAGAGVAGLAATVLLARAGHRVTLYDQFDAPRPTGSGLLMQPTGMAVLRMLGLDEAVRRRGRAIRRLRGLAEGRAVLDVDLTAAGEGRMAYGIHRSTLFDILWTAARASGATIVHPARVAGVEAHDGRWRLTFEDRPAGSAIDLVVDALGARSALAAHHGRPLAYGAFWGTVDWTDDTPPDDHLSQRYRAARQMAGLLPVGEVVGQAGPKAAIFWSIRGDRIDRARQEGIVAWHEEWDRLWPETSAIARRIMGFEQLNLARYTHHTLPRPVGAGIVHLGDAWHSTSPQLGQGANMALLDAYALALALEAEQGIDAALRHVMALRQGHVRLYQTLSRFLTPVYQSDGRLVPMLRDRLVGPLSGFGPVQKLQARLVSGLVGGPLARLGL